MPRLARRAALALLLGLAACAPAPDPLTQDLPDLGAFELGFNIVVADDMQQVPPSRNATPEEWVAVMQSEIDRRFGRYEGGRRYHFGISVDGYALAPPGIPVVLAPKSILVITANIWDDSLGRKVAGPEQFMVFEGTSPETIIGSGVVRTREEQMQILARNAAQRIQQWMLQNPDLFFIDADVAAAAEAQISAELAEQDALLEEATQAQGGQ